MLISHRNLINHISELMTVDQSANSYSIVGSHHGPILDLNATFTEKLSSVGFSISLKPFILENFHISYWYEFMSFFGV